MSEFSINFINNFRSVSTHNNISYSISGSRFALLELKVIIYNLILNFEIVKCEKTIDPIRLQPADFTVRALGGSWVKFERRISAWIIEIKLQACICLDKFCNLINVKVYVMFGLSRFWNYLCDLRYMWLQGMNKL